MRTGTRTHIRTRHAGFTAPPLGLRWWVASVMFLALAACGGGGDTAPASLPVPPPGAGSSPAPAPSPGTARMSVSVVGSGRVSSTPSGIDCATNCSLDLNTGASVQLSAVPDQGHRFAGWSGLCRGAGACSTTLQAAGTATATFAPLSTARFPLRLSADKKFLLDAQDQPFLITGDAAWSLPTQLSRADALVYLDDRQRRGFNTILVEMMEHKFSSHSPRWANAAGDVPFRDNNDFTTTNAAFFDHVAWVIQQAADRGMLVLITPAYIGWGCGDEGWCAEMRSNGTSRLTQYGRFLGQRFHDLPNLVWVHGGDHVPSTSGSPSEMDLVIALMNGIKATDGTAHLHTAHWDRGTSSSEVAGFPGLDLDATYSGAGLQTYTDSLDDWRRDRGVRPSLLFEGLYESEHNTSAMLQRAQMIQPLLSGATGFLLGNDPMWYFGTPGDGNPGWPFISGPSMTWQAALGSPGARHAARTRQFFSAIAWQDLLPDTAHETLTAGYAGSNADSNAVLARSGDGRLAVAYLTARLTVTINMGRFTAPVLATWIDPVSGAMQAASNSALANSGTRTFTPPAANAEGSADWLLLLQAP